MKTGAQKGLLDDSSAQHKNCESHLPGEVDPFKRMEEAKAYPPLPVEEQVSSYLAFLQVRGRTPGTIRFSKYGITLFSAFLVKSKIRDLREVDKGTIGRFKQHIFAYRTGDGDPLEFRTQKNVLTIIKGFFRFLLDFGRIPASPAASLTYPRLPKKLSRNQITQEEMRAFLEGVATETVMGFYDRTLFEVLYSTGMRQGEISKLKLEDLNLAEGLLTVREGKGEVDRVIPLTQTSINYLTAYLGGVRERYLGVMKGAGNESPLVFPNTKGNPLTAEDLGRKMVRYVTLSKLGPHLTTHMFRRSISSHLIKNGVDLRYVQELLGHKNPKTTLGYIHIDIEDLKETLNRCHPRCSPIREKLGGSHE